MGRPPAPQALPRGSSLKYHYKKYWISKMIICKVSVWYLSMKALMIQKILRVILTQ